METIQKETIQKVNLQPVASVRKWDTKRIKAYMVRIQKHISFLESGKPYDNEDHYGENRQPLSQEKIENQEGIVLQKFKNYKEELKKILEGREHIE